jgi:hypothetical protein
MSENEESVSFNNRMIDSLM